MGLLANWNIASTAPHDIPDTYMRRASNDPAIGAQIEIWLQHRVPYDLIEDVLDEREHSPQLPLPTLEYFQNLMSARGIQQDKSSSMSDVKDYIRKKFSSLTKGWIGREPALPPSILLRDILQPWQVEAVSDQAECDAAYVTELVNLWHREGKNLTDKSIWQIARMIREHRNPSHEPS